MGVAVDLMRAHRAGRQAAQDGQLRSTCPHPPRGDSRDRVLFTTWMRGYAEVIPSPIDYTEDGGDDE